MRTNKGRPPLLDGQLTREANDRAGGTDHDLEFAGFHPPVEVAVHQFEAVETRGRDTVFDSSLSPPMPTVDAGGRFDYPLNRTQRPDWRDRSIYASNGKRSAAG